MTDVGTSGSGGLALDQYSATLPPGWRPGLTHFPFRRYLERMRLWYRMNTLHPSQLGPAVAGRLQGKPFNMAMRLRITVRDGRTLVGDNALAYEGLPADDQTGTVACESGLQVLIRAMQSRYGTEDEADLVESLDRFFDFRRGNLSLIEYVTE